MPVVISRTVACAAIALLGSAAGALPAGAAAPPRTLRLVSGGVADVGATPLGIADDGSRVVFETTESLVAGDPPGTLDLYARDADGALQRLTLGAADGYALAAISRDGAYVWYGTQAREAPEDVDAADDVYEIGREGRRRLVSAGVEAAAFVGASGDGAHVLFAIDEALGGTGDLDAAIDVYDRRRDGSLRLATPATAQPLLVPREAVAPAGGALRVATTEALVPEDVDGVLDDYAVPLAGGPYRLLTGPTADETARVVADDVGTLVVETDERLLPVDVDGSADVYLRAPDGALRLVSGGRGDHAAGLERTSRDGRRVLFRTAERLLSADGDADADLYLWSADAPLRVLAPALPTGALGTALWVGADGAVVVGTTASLLPVDVDASVDVYVVGPDGALRLLTPGTPGNAYDAVGISVRSRPRFVVQLAADLAGDGNGVPDAYELTSDGLRLLAPGLAGGSLATTMMAVDGSRLVLTTTTTVPGTGDADTADDVYEADVAQPVLGSAPAVAGPGRVGATLACAAPAVTGELVTLSRAWLRDGAPIAGATGAERIAARADAGHDIACRVTATNPLGTAVRTSAARRIAPAARVTALAGVPVVGTRLVCTAFDGATSVAYRWTRAGRVVAGRTGPRYRVGAADLGRRVACRATARSGQATTVVALGRVVPRRCAVPALRGLEPGAAVARLGAAGCRARVVRRAGRGVPAGRVLGTTPPAGVRRANGAVIVVRVRR